MVFAPASAAAVTFSQGYEDSEGLAWTNANNYLNDTFGKAQQCKDDAKTGSASIKLEYLTNDTANRLVAYRVGTTNPCQW